MTGFNMKSKLRLKLKTRREVCPSGHSYKVGMMWGCSRCERYAEVLLNGRTLRGCDCDKKPQKLLIKSCVICEINELPSLECLSCRRKFRKRNIGLHRFCYYCPECSGYNTLVSNSQI